jgi:hypothetical protein
MSTATLGNALTTRYHEEPDAALVDRDDKRLALRCLNDAIDAGGTARKALAGDCRMSEAQFSRLTSGVQGFPLSLLDQLPDSIVLDYLDRMAHERGAHVEREDAAVLAATRLAEAAMQFVRVKVRMAKAVR